MCDPTQTLPDRLTSVKGIPISPASLPLSSAGQTFTLGLTGSGFVPYIQGTAAANTAGTCLLTVTATDPSIFRVSGTWIFTVGGGLVVNVGSLINTPFGTAASITLTAVGGAYPYTCSITTPGSIPVGLALSIPTPNVLFNVSTATPAGTYGVVVTATDLATAAVTGTASFSACRNRAKTLSD